MLKMLLDPMGGIVMTNDGNAILREIDVQHPAAKSMIELARVLSAYYLFFRRKMKKLEMELHQSSSLQEK
jgi:hypothetical protein